MEILKNISLILNVTLDLAIIITIITVYLKNKFNVYKSIALFLFTDLILIFLNILTKSFINDTLTVIIIFILITIYFQGTIFKKFKLYIITILSINIVFFLVSLIFEILMNWSRKIISENVINSAIQEYISYIIIFAIVIFIITKHRYREIKNNVEFLLSVITIVTINIILLIETFNFYITSDFTKSSFEKIVLKISLTVFLIVIVTLLLFNRLQAQLLKMHETEIKALNSERMSEYYRNLAGNTEEIRKFRHDMRYHAQVIDTYLDQGQTLKARDYLNTNIGHLSYRNIIYIEGLPVVSAILSDIQAKCKLLDYRFEPEVYVNYIPMDDDDTSVIIGNILTNALEALEKDSTDDRFILFEIKATAEVTVISCRNHYVGKLLPKGTLYRTTKSNASNHGYGLNTIQERAAKYNGIMEIIPKDQVFHIQIFLPNNNPQSSAES